MQQRVLDRPSRPIQMREVFSRLKGRLKHGLLVQEALDRLARRGLVLYPYLVFVEAVDTSSRHATDLPNLHTRRLSLSIVLFRKFSRDLLLKRYDQPA